MIAARFPKKESGPWLTIISFITPKAPLPDTGLINAKGAISLGIPNRLVMGLNS